MSKPLFPKEWFEWKEEYRELFRIAREKGKKVFYPSGEPRGYVLDGCLYVCHDPKLEII
jgi:hypothetical protein